VLRPAAARKLRGSSGAEAGAPILGTEGRNREAGCTSRLVTGARENLDPGLTLAISLLALEMARPFGLSSVDHGVRAATSWHQDGTPDCDLTMAELASARREWSYRVSTN
jgi:hypothetical protein